SGPGPAKTPPPPASPAPPLAEKFTNHPRRSVRCVAFETWTPAKPVTPRPTLAPAPKDSVVPNATGIAPWNRTTPQRLTLTPTPKPAAEASPHTPMVWDADILVTWSVSQLWHLLGSQNCKQANPVGSVALR